MVERGTNALLIESENTCFWSLPKKDWTVDKDGSTVFNKAHSPTKIKDSLTEFMRPPPKNWDRTGGYKEKWGQGLSAER